MHICIKQSNCFYAGKLYLDSRLYLELATREQVGGGGGGRVIILKNQSFHFEDESKIFKFDTPDFLVLCQLMDSSVESARWPKGTVWRHPTRHITSAKE